MNFINLSKLNKHIRGTVPEHFVNNPGVEPYGYYAMLSLFLSPNSIIADLGTYQGLSALALSINPKVHVYSYDISLKENLVKSRKNITFIQDDIFRRCPSILKCDLILIDVDPHDGIQEQDFFDILIENNYSGITIWDDINHNLGMKNFWHKIKLPKEDKTTIGHHSGTGYIKWKQ